MPAKEMWVALNDLYLSKNENRVMVLRERLRSTKMENGEGVIHYLTRLTQIKDELASVGEKTKDSKLVYVALNGFSKSWDVFVHGVVSREKLPNWQCLWDDFLQEDCWVAKVPSIYQPFTSLSLHFQFTFNHIPLSHTLTLNHFHDYMGFRHIVFQCIYFSVFE
jgi:hypothetical protein